MGLLALALSPCLVYATASRKTLRADGDIYGANPILHLHVLIPAIYWAYQAPPRLHDTRVPPWEEHSLIHQVRRQVKDAKFLHLKVLSSVCVVLIAFLPCLICSWSD